MQRAKTLSGLFLQVLRVRWAALGSPAKIALVVSVLLGAAMAVRVSACFLGAGCAASPCDAPCNYADASEEPCPFAAREAELARERAAAEVDEPPCHAE